VGGVQRQYGQWQADRHEAEKNYQVER
jgi:hypothetical protein